MARGAKNTKIFPAASKGRTHAFDGWPWKVTPGLRDAGTAQRNGFTAARDVSSGSRVPLSRPQRIHVRLHARFVFVRPVSTRLQLRFLIRLREGRRLAGLCGPSRADLELERRACCGGWRSYRS